jgi:hypothetical protein
MNRLLVAVLVVCVFGLPAAMQLASKPAYACSAAYSFDYVVHDIDAADIVYVESVQGAENREPPAVSTVSPERRAAISSRTTPIDREGYGASVRLHTTIIGSLPSTFDLDAEVRRGMERSIRAIESGYVPPCPVNFVIAHYIPKQYYLVLLEKDNGGNWQTYATFNYRVEGPDLLTTKVYPEEQRGSSGPWPIEINLPMYERFFAGLPERSVYTDLLKDRVVPPEEDIRHLEAERVSIDAYIAALRATRAQPFTPFEPSIRPPTTGDAGLAR